MNLYEAPHHLSSIPVIDLAPLRGGDVRDKEKIAAAIGKACRDIGFFYLANANVDRDLVEAQFVWARRFFDLPLEEKLTIDMKKSPTAAGYEPVGAQVLDSQDDKLAKAPPDLKESFYCGRELAPGDPLADAKIRSFGHNLWPNLPGFSAQMQAYHAAMSSLGADILGLLALSLDLPEHWFAPFYEPSSGTLRLIKYPPHPVDAAANQIGAGAHTDWGGVTILAQDDAGGLEVRTVSGAWIEAPPIPGTFVVNLGDLMARWTNGVYASNMHRVKNNRSGRDRYSIPFFHAPFPRSLIEAIPTCVDDGHPRRFPPCTAAEHFAEMFQRSYGYRPGAAT